MILDLESGSIIKDHGIHATWAQWLPSDSFSLLLYQEGNDLGFILEGTHRLDINIQLDFTATIAALTPDLKHLILASADGQIRLYATGLSSSKLASINSILSKISGVTQDLESLAAFKESVKKYSNGIKWIHDKIAKLHPNNNFDSALNSLALLADIPGSAVLAQFKQDVSSRDAYRFRDQLVRCFEDMRKKLDALDFPCAKSLNELVPKVDDQLKFLLAWFLGLFSAPGTEKESSLYKIQESLNPSTLNAILSIIEHMLNEYEQRKITLDKKLHHIFQEAPRLCHTFKAAENPIAITVGESISVISWLPDYLELIPLHINEQEGPLLQPGFTQKHAGEFVKAMPSNGKISILHASGKLEIIDSTNFYSPPSAFRTLSQGSAVDCIQYYVHPHSGTVNIL